MTPSPHAMLSKNDETLSPAVRGQGEGDDPVYRNSSTPHPDLLPSARGEAIKRNNLSPCREL